MAESLAPPDFKSRTRVFSSRFKMDHYQQRGFSPRPPARVGATVASVRRSIVSKYKKKGIFNLAHPTDDRQDHSQPATHRAAHRPLRSSCPRAVLPRPPLLKQRQLPIAALLFGIRVVVKMIDLGAVSAALAYRLNQSMAVLSAWATVWTPRPHFCCGSFDTLHRLG